MSFSLSSNGICVLSRNGSIVDGKRQNSFFPIKSYRRWLLASFLGTWPASGVFRRIRTIKFGNIKVELPVLHSSDAAIRYASGICQLRWQTGHWMN